MDKVFVPATNRQKKVLNFFEVPFTERITRGAAGLIIGNIFGDDKNQRVRWHKYLYLTSDFDVTSPEIDAYDNAELANLVLPKKWNPLSELQKVRDKILELEYQNGSPYDLPYPELFFTGNEYVFTGVFDFGTQAVLKKAIADLGGVIKSTGKIVSMTTHVVVVGEKGSGTWKHGKYGNKIEDAVILRSEFGTPVIVPEAHWIESMEKQRSKEL